MVPPRIRVTTGPPRLKDAQKHCPACRKSLKQRVILSRFDLQIFTSKPHASDLIFDSRAGSDEIESPLSRHARACRGHPRLSCGPSARKTWMAGTSPAMTAEKWFDMTGTRSS